MDAVRLADLLPIAVARLDRTGVVADCNAAWRALGPDHVVPCPPVGATVGATSAGGIVPARRALQAALDGGVRRA
ncbi:MAG: hypothetical protein ACOCYE_11010, partial [Pseudomonadota bacterium]